MIGRRERWSYAAGDLGFNFVWQSIELYLFYFYVRGLGLTPATASTIYALGVLADLVADPLVGMLSDRLAPDLKLGRWVAIGGPASVLLLVAAFSPPPLPHRLLAGETLAIFVALRLCYSVGNVPYAALTTRLSPEPGDHLALTGARMVGAALGGTIVAATFLRMQRADGLAADFRRGAIILAVAAIPAFACTVFGTRERVQPAARAAGGEGFGAFLVPLARSAELRRLLAVILLGGLAVTIVNKALLFLFEEQRATRLGFWVALAPGLSLLITAPLWALLARRIGRVRTLILAAGLKTAAILLAVLASGLAAVATLVILSVAAGAGLSVMFWSLVPAAVADCEARAGGAGYAGRVYAMANVARKLAQAIAPAVIALALDSPTLSVMQSVAAITLAAFAATLLLYGRAAGSQPRSSPV